MSRDQSVKPPGIQLWQMALLMTPKTLRNFMHRTLRIRNRSYWVLRLLTARVTSHHQRKKKITNRSKFPSFVYRLFNDALYIVYESMIRMMS
jgi:hypothetical protein